MVMRTEIRWILECAGRLNWGSNSEHDSGLGHPSHDLLPFVAVNPTLSVPKNGWNCEWDNFNKFQKQKNSLQKNEEDPTNNHQKPQTNNHLKPIHNGSFKPANLSSAPCWCHDRVREGLLPRKPGWTGWFKVHLWDVLKSEWASLCHRITTSSRLGFAFLNFQQKQIDWWTGFNNTPRHSLQTNSQTSKIESINGTWQFSHVIKATKVFPNKPVSVSMTQIQSLEKTSTIRRTLRSASVGLGAIFACSQMCQNKEHKQKGRYPQKPQRSIRPQFLVTHKF